VGGIVPKADLKWAEAVQFRLDHRLDRLWLLLLPTIWIERTEDDGAFEIAKEFCRERLAIRRNAESNSVLDAWVHLVLGDTEGAQLSAFGLTEGDGMDACFTLGTMTAFSRRGARRVEPPSTDVAAAWEGNAVPGDARG
jgi:hypothetical protein